MPFYTATFQHGQTVLRYARQYRGQYSHNADNAFRAAALPAAAAALGIPQSQLRGTYQHVQNLPPPQDHIMI